MSFTTPSKRIFEPLDLPNFRRSVAFAKLRQVLMKITEKVKGHEIPSSVLNMNLVTRTTNESKFQQPIPEPQEISKPSNYTGILAILSQLNQLIDETPPLEGPKRFGNFARREWHEKVEQQMDSLLVDNIKTTQPGIFIELKYYLVNSFGSSLRLDYGTGHELSFIAFIGSLMEYELLDISGTELLILFAKYYDLVRRLILDYNLEPAGSHGVWGLDDHFHFIYIIGAAQFNSNPNAPPLSQILTSNTINSYKRSNLYVNAIAFIYKIKLGPFNEHSPILYDINTAVVLWSKVLKGLLKMYDDEVLNKFPVVQHFWFGNVLYPWKDLETKEELPVAVRDSNDAFLNKDRGVNTTKTNISMTGAPWANSTTTTGNIGRTPIIPTGRQPPNSTFTSRR